MAWFIYSLLFVVLLLILLMITGYGTFIKRNDIFLYVGLFVIAFFLHRFNAIPSDFITSAFSLSVAFCLYYRTRNVFISVTLASINYSLALLVWYATFALFHFTFPEYSANTYPYINVPTLVFILFISIAILVFLLSALLIRKLDAKYKFVQTLEMGYHKFYTLSVLLFVGVVASGIFHAFASTHIDYQEYTIISFFSYVALLLASIVFAILIIKTNAQEIYLAEKSSYANQLEAENQSMQYFRHDYKNILLTMSIFMENDDMEGLKNYFYNDLNVYSKEELDLAPLFKDLQNIKILPLKGIIVEKMKQAEQQNISISIYVPELITRIPMPVIKLVRCLSILLDNALEESKLVAQPEIRIEILVESGTTTVKITNQKRDAKAIPVGTLTRKGYTTKGEGRGKGLSSLTRLIHTTKNASYIIQQDDETFSCFIFLQD
ncbi:GHKL domain-containing protein [Listeria booriae]|uniref:GHKL domain-containing protein n=1 Tax=Listeria booriae TaxID=1552123 RepID=A0A7X0Z379_9LIST|nr:GHKL domain-containing protein [Listeria booriae]MBC2175063.1 GHKL domain-containing protein [Listeria booriae]